MIQVPASTAEEAAEDQGVSLCCAFVRSEQVQQARLQETGTCNDCWVHFQALTSAALAALSDLIAQRIVGKGPLNWRRTGALCIFGFCVERALSPLLAAAHRALVQRQAG